MIELAVIADFRYVAEAGGEPQAIARIESTMAAAGELVLRDLGVAVSIVDLIVYSEEGSLTLNESDVGEIDDILSAAAQTRNLSTGSLGLADGLFVWTGSGGTGGNDLATVDEECSEHAVAVAKFDRSEVETLFAARSIGRLVGAPDDKKTRCALDTSFIMGNAPSLDSPSFSSCSRDEVQARRVANQCFHTQGDGLVEAVCGDGQIAIGEDCDEGQDNGLGACALDCTWAARVEVAVVLDHRYIASAGGEQAAQIRAQAVLAGAQRLLTRDLHVSLEIADLASFPSPGGPAFNDPGFAALFPYLQALTASRGADDGALASADLVLAMTDVDPSLTGLAWQDEACGSYAAGVTQIRPAIASEVLIAARTLARGIGAKSDAATGCDANAGFVMGNLPGAISPEFSACSTADVTAFVETAACIGTNL